MNVVEHNIEVLFFDDTEPRNHYHTLNVIKTGSYQRGCERLSFIR
jgi:hypothetical protein